MKNIIKRTKTTLKNQNGVTVVFALVIFMVAAIISVTIVNAALNNLSRVNSQRTNEQARIAVMSAADYLQKGNSELKAALKELVQKDYSDSIPDWTISASGEASSALGVTIDWTGIVKGYSLDATIRSGSGADEYDVDIIMVYTPAASP